KLAPRARVLFLRRYRGRGIVVAGETTIDSGAHRAAVSLSWDHCSSCLEQCAPPGAGKTMLAERMPSILPPLDRQASLEVTAVHSVAGLLPPGRPLIDAAPYCAPHHSATMQALVGGGPG